MADLHDALAELAPQVLKLIDDRLLGIYLVDDLGGTGYTDVVPGRSQSRAAARR
jgi:hypothetical protein